MTALNGAAASAAAPSNFENDADAFDTTVDVFSGRLSSNGAQTSNGKSLVAEAASPAALTAALQVGVGTTGLASSMSAESSSTSAAPGQNGSLNGRSNGALLNGAPANGASANGAGPSQRPSPQSRQKGTVWGQGAATAAAPKKDRIDENYEQALRLLSPLR